jgi:hypothetical protein
MGKTVRFHLADLKAMPQKTISVHNQHNNSAETYSGVPLSDLLAKTGFVAGPTLSRSILRSYLRAEGTDQYWVLYSATEVEPSGHKGDVIVATSINGKPLGVEGSLKLVSTEDAQPQRWVRNLRSVTVVAAN